MQLLEYVPTGDAAFTVVVQVGAFVNTAGVSPFTNPEYAGEIVGDGYPYVVDVLCGVIVRGAWAKSTVVAPVL